jgi:hypothetical protein
VGGEKAFDNVTDLKNEDFIFVYWVFRMGWAKLQDLSAKELYELIIYLCLVEREIEDLTHW